VSGTGNSLDNLITGNAGRNFLVGLEGNDTLLGGDEDDTIKGGEGDDVLSGGGGADYLYGDHGDDSLNGGDGNDYFGLNDQGSDTVDGGTGYDFLSADFSESPVALNLTLGMTSPGGMQVTNVERVWMYFGNQADYFNSGTGTDVIVFAEGGDDTLVGAGGGDELFGDDGNDSLTGAGGIDDLDGGSGADWLDGGAGHDILYGGDGIDSLMGGEGNDYLSGGFGGDWLDGGAGADIIWCESFVFTWDKAPDTVALNSFIGSDRVIGFESGIDKLMVSAASIPVGDGDLGLEGATTRAAPGGFDTSAELVIFSSNITGPIDAGSAAAAIGSANSAYSAGQTALFVVDNGADSAVFYFKSAGADALVSASELTLLATLSGTPATDVGDYLLGA
jgi:Ca2+-binding RTX toxin-like protein